MRWATVMMAHELAHLVVDTRRDAADKPFEAPWLDEALAALGQERVSLYAAGMTAGATDMGLWMRDFLVSVYVDDSAIANLDVSTLPYQAATWNYRSLFQALSYTLAPRALSSTTSTSITIEPGGSAGYFSFSVPAGGNSTIDLTLPSETPTDAWYMVLRRN